MVAVLKKFLPADLDICLLSGVPLNETLTLDGNRSDKFDLITGS